MVDEVIIVSFNRVFDASLCPAWGFWPGRSSLQPCPATSVPWYCRSASSGKQQHWRWITREFWGFCSTSAASPSFEKVTWRSCAEEGSFPQASGGCASCALVTSPCKWQSTMRKALNRSQTCSNLTCAAWHPHLDFVECYEFWQSSKDCQKLYHHYGPWIFTNHAISCANWKSTSDDIGWEKDMLFRQTPLAPQLAAWPSHHFHDIHHAAVHPGAKCWQMPLDPLCSFTALFTFPLTQSSVVALPALGPLPIRSHKKPNLSPTFPSILSAPFDEKSSGENSWRFSDFKGFQSVSNVNLIQNPQILTSTSPQTAQTASSALEASENVINPNPRDSPLSRSLMSCTLISPHLRNASRTSSWKLKIVGSLDPKECCWKSRKKNTNWRLWSWKSWPKKQLSFISIPTIQDKNCHSQRPLWHQVTASGEVTPLRMSNITGTKADFNRKPMAKSKIKKTKTTVNYRFSRRYQW